MGRPYFLDLRERVAAAVEKGGMSRRRAAASLALPSVRSSIGSSVCGRPAALRQARWVGTSLRRRRAPRLAVATGQGGRLHLALARRRVRRARPESRLPLGLELRAHREAQLQKKASPPANAT